MKSLFVVICVLMIATLLQDARTFTISGLFGEETSESLNTTKIGEGISLDDHLLDNDDKELDEEEEEYDPLQLLYESSESIKPYLEIFSTKNVHENILPTICGDRGVKAIRFRWDACVNFTQTVLNGEKAAREWYDYKNRVSHLGISMYKYLTNCHIEGAYDEFFCFINAVNVSLPEFQRLVIHTQTLLMTTHTVLTTVFGELTKCFTIKPDVFKTIRSDCSINYFSLLNLARVFYTHT